MNKWLSEDYRRHAAYVPALGEAVAALLHPLPGERILDLGCGEGSLTERIAASGATVVGIDVSAEMVAAATARGLDARLVSAENLPFDEEFDAVFSNAVLHWVRDHNAMLDGVNRALRPGGRFVAEFGGRGNVEAIERAVREELARWGSEAASPRYYPSEAAYAARLEAHGFTVTQIALIPRPTVLPTGIRGWIETFERSTLERLSEAQRESLIRGVEERLRSDCCDESGQWTAHYVRLRFRACKT